MGLRSPLVAGLTLLASTGFLLAQPAAPATSASTQTAPLRVFANAAKLRATVIDVSAAENLMILRSDDGHEQAVKVTPDALRGNGIAVGDRVNAELREATAISVRKTEASAGASSGTTLRAVAKAELAPLREGQEAMTTDVIEITAPIRDINYARRQVSVLDPDGRPRIINVSDNVQNLDDLNEGDVIVIRYTEAVAVAITK